MEVRENVSWRELTTFKVGGTARYAVACSSFSDIEEALALARARDLPLVVLGEGSNVLPDDDDFEGVVIAIRSKGIEAKEKDSAVHLTAEAGESWDALVTYATGKGWWGIENLAGIPGTVGAAPVQNIGAYGMEVASVIESVEAYDMQEKNVVTLSPSEMAFGYRDSLFKHGARYIILRVTFILSATGTPHIGYADLKRAHDEGVDLSSPRAIAEAVRAIRAKKFPDLAVYGTAGSFFKNPILSPEAFAELAREYGAIPSFPQEKGVKVPLAFILDHVLGLKGYENGNAFLFGNQPLVLVARRGVRAEEVEALARFIEEKVFERTRIRIEREVRNVSAIKIEKVF